MMTQVVLEAIQHFQLLLHLAVVVEAHGTADNGETAVQAAAEARITVTNQAVRNKLTNHSAERVTEIEVAILFIRPQAFTFGLEAAAVPALEVRTDQHTQVVHKHLQAA